jgi:hypothetical protein
MSNKEYHPDQSINKKYKYYNFNKNLTLQVLEGLEICRLIENVHQSELYSFIMM